MIVYQYSNEGFFECITEADESPLEPGVFLIPSKCTEVPIPDVCLTKDQRFKWNGDSWEVFTFDSDFVAISKLKNFLINNPDVMELISR